MVEGECERPSGKNYHGRKERGDMGETFEIFSKSSIIKTVMEKLPPKDIRSIQRDCGRKGNARSRADKSYFF